MDAVDRQIVELLRESGRRSNVEVARSMGLCEGAVRKRIDRLLADGLLHIRAVVDPAAAGYGTRAFIQLTVEIKRINDVGRRLAEMPEVRAVHALTGEHDLLVEVAAPSEGALLAFLRERVAPLEGVLSSRTSHVVSTFKAPHEWAPPAPAPPAVLVADDDPDFLEITRSMLASSGYRVRTASSGSAALQSLRAEGADLVVLDIMMNGILDGWNAGRLVREDPAVRDTPILVVSSITSSEYLGMMPTDDDHLIDGFLSKPVDPERFLKEVGRLVRR